MEKGAVEIEIMKYILDSLCVAELSNKGRQFIINEIKLRGGNYTK